MEWLINAWNEFYTQIMATGAVGLIAFKTFILDYKSNKKYMNNFGSISSSTTSIKNDIKKIVETEINKLLKGEEIIFEKFNDFQNVFNSLIQKIDLMEKENTTLVNLLVHSYSLVNVPTDKKEQTFNALKSISSINDNVLESLKISISQDQAKKQELKTETNDTLTNLDNIIV